MTGSRPFAGGPPTAQARQHAEAQPAPASSAAPGLPPALDAVLARGLAKDPGERPRTATELVAAIESALAARAETEPTRPFAVVEPARRVTPLHPSPPAGAAAAPPTARARETAVPPTARRAPARRRASARPAAAPATAARRAPWPALLAAALLAAATVGLVLALTGGGAEPRRELGARSQTTAAPASGSSRTATTAAAAPQPPPPPPPAAAAGYSPSALNDRGYALLQQGRYGEAIEPLSASVQGYQAAGESGLP